MFDIEEILKIPPYSLDKDAKASLYKDAFGELTAYHYENCEPYRHILDGLSFRPKMSKDISDFPYLPVRIFKTRELISVDGSKIFKTMTSSGTTGQAVSKIFLDRETSAVQTKALARITSDFLGQKRLPMIVIDSSEVLRDRNMFSARGAGILGFSMLGRDVIYALNDRMNVNREALGGFMDRHKDGPVLLFGFTFIIWEHFYKPMMDSGDLRFPGGILIHGGGWKKLQSESVSAERFKNALGEAFDLRRVYNYYGMVEQTGSIFMECESGRLHCSVFSDVVTRRHRDFAPCGIGEQGLIQVISLLPRSYPGHSILTEDLGRVIGVDDCPCGRLGKTFNVEGRIQQAEARGCSDTYERR